MAKRTKQAKLRSSEEEPLVQVDEAALEQRRRDTEAFMNSPAMVAEMEACRRVFEEEQRQKVSDEQPDEDEDSELAAWAQKLVAERAPDRLEDTDGEEDD